MSEAVIAENLYVAVTNAAASLSPLLPVQFPGRVFDIPSNGRYIEVIQIRNNRQGEYYGDERTYQGILRLLVHWPNDDAGAIPPLVYCEGIADALPKGTRFGNTVLYDVPEVGSVVEDQGQIFYPISFRYRDFYTG